MQKNAQNEIRFVLLEKIGRAVYDIHVDNELIIEAMGQLIAG